MKNTLGLGWNLALVFVACSSSGGTSAGVDAVVLDAVLRDGATTLGQGGSLGSGGRIDQDAPVNIPGDRPPGAGGAGGSRPPTDIRVADQTQPSLGLDSRPATGCFPPCLDKLFSQCPLAGNCMREGMGIRQYCFGNGVKMRFQFPLQENSYAYVGKPDGLSRCFYLVVTRASTPAELEYYDSRGGLVSRITFPTPQATKGVATCMGMPGTWEVDLGSLACADSRNGIPGEASITCPFGTCSAPIPPLDKP